MTSFRPSWGAADDASYGSARDSTATTAHDADELIGRDHGRLLWSLAMAGAAVRRTTSSDVSWEAADLGGPPRSVLVLADGATAPVAPLLAALGSAVASVVTLAGAELPRYVGATDALLVVSADGRSPDAVAAVAQAVRRGLALVVVAPARSPVAVAAAGRGVVVDVPGDGTPRAAFWSALGPALVAARTWRLGPGVEPAVLADALDDTAQRCRPGSDAVANPARALADEFADEPGVVPVIVGAGPLSDVAADRMAAALRVAGVLPAFSAHLPSALPELTALVGSAPAAGDFFRDRVDEPASGIRLVLVEADAPAASLLRGQAEAAGVRCTVLPVPGGPDVAPLVRFATAALTGDFTAAYAALVRGLDPSVPRPGELP